MNYKSYIENRSEDRAGAEAYAIITGGNAPDLDEARQIHEAIGAATEALDDENAAKCSILYEPWDETATYEEGDRRRYNDALYKCLQAHTAQAVWNPVDATSLWAKVLIPDPEVIPEWEQPSSTNPYMTGDKVTHNGKTWASTIDNNVWEPGVYGWEEVE